MSILFNINFLKLANFLVNFYRKMEYSDDHIISVFSKGYFALQRL